MTSKSIPNKINATMVFAVRFCPAGDKVARINLITLYLVEVQQDAPSIMVGEKAADLIKQDEGRI